MKKPKIQEKTLSEVDVTKPKGLKLPPIKTNLKKIDPINNSSNSPSSNSKSRKIINKKITRENSQINNNNNQNISKDKTNIKSIEPIDQKTLTKPSIRTKSENHFLRKIIKKPNIHLNENIKELPKISQEKLAELKEKKLKRLKEEKIAEENDKKLFNQLMEEYKKIPGDKKQNNLNKISLDDVPKIKISEKKAQEILEEGGMLDAYNYLVIQLCKNGLPDGDIFNYAAYIFKNYEKKWKEKKY